MHQIKEDRLTHLPFVIGLVADCLTPEQEEAALLAIAQLAKQLRSAMPHTPLVVLTLLQCRQEAEAARHWQALGAHVWQLKGTAQAELGNSFQLAGPLLNVPAVPNNLKDPKPAHWDLAWLCAHCNL
jgi:hypothetical protein